MNIINQIGSFMSSTAKEVMGILVWRYYKVLENKKLFLLLPWKLNKQTKKNNNPKTINILFQRRVPSYLDVCQMLQKRSHN